MKQIIIAILVVASFSANAQRTSQSHFVIKGVILNGIDVRYGNESGSIEIYKEKGKQHFDLKDHLGEIMRGTLTSNKTPSYKTSKSDNQFASVVSNKTWIGEQTYNDQFVPMSFDIMFSVIFHPALRSFTLKIPKLTLEYYGYQED